MLAPPRRARVSRRGTKHRLGSKCIRFTRDIILSNSPRSPKNHSALGHPLRKNSDGPAYRAERSGPIGVVLGMAFIFMLLIFRRFFAELTGFCAKQPTKKVAGRLFQRNPYASVFNACNNTDMTHLGTRKHR